MRPPPRVLVLEPAAELTCAAGHNVDILPELYRRLGFFLRCTSKIGTLYSPKLGNCDQCLYVRPAGKAAGADMVLVTDCTSAQVRAMDGRDLLAWEVAERVAADWRAARRALRKHG